MIRVRHLSRQLLIGTALLSAVVESTQAQAVEIQLTDTSGKPLTKAVVQVLAHTSTIPLLIDTFPPGNSRALVRLPTAPTNKKLYVLEFCATGYAPQFVTAPFGKLDTLRLAVQLAPLAPDSARALEPCAGTPDPVTRGTVTDTSTFIGLAAASNLEIDRLQSVRNNLRDPGTQHDSVEAVSYRQRTLAELEQRLGRAKSASERARVAHTMLSFALFSHASFNPVTRVKVLAALPPDSKWWLTGPYVVGLWGTQLLFVSEVAGDPVQLTNSVTTRRKMEAFLDRMANSLDEPEIRSEAQSQLVRLAYMDADTVRADSLLNQMLAETPNYPLTRLVASRHAPNRPLREGAVIPAFDFPALPDTANHITNATIAGKFTLIEFWGTWCGPCLRAMPELHRVYRAYHDRGFEILSVAAVETPELVKNFRATKWPMPWLNAFARYSEGANDNPNLLALGVVVFPQTVLVDPQGKIIAVFGPEIEELASTLNRVLPR